MAQQDKTLLIVTPSSPNGAVGEYFPVPIALAGNPTFDKITGSGGWQVVERPKQKAATQWYDESPYELTISGILDLTVTRSSHTVDQDVAQIISWQKVPTLHASVIQPPTLRLSGPVLGTDLTWVVYSVKWGEAIRVANIDSGSGGGGRGPGQGGGPPDNTIPGSTPLNGGTLYYGGTGSLMQQAFEMVLYEYIPPFPSTSTPTATHKKNTTNLSSKTYTIVKGDTLAKIALKTMGSAKIENQQDIIAANGGGYVNARIKIRSGSQIAGLVGVKIRIPSA